LTGLLAIRRLSIRVVELRSLLGIGVVILLLGRHLLYLRDTDGLLSVAVVLCWQRLLRRSSLRMGVSLGLGLGLIALSSQAEEDSENDGAQDGKASNYSTCNGTDRCGLLGLRMCS
jgi:hypothetical protein